MPTLYSSHQHLLEMAIKRAVLYCHLYSKIGGEEEPPQSFHKSNLVACPNKSLARQKLIPYFPPGKIPKRLVSCLISMAKRAAEILLMILGFYLEPHKEVLSRCRTTPYSILVAAQDPLFRSCPQLREAAIQVLLLNQDQITLKDATQSHRVLQDFIGRDRMSKFKTVHIEPEFLRPPKAPEEWEPFPILCDYAARTYNFSRNITKRVVDVVFRYFSNAHIEITLSHEWSWWQNQSTYDYRSTSYLTSTIQHPTEPFNQTRRIDMRPYTGMTEIQQRLVHGLMDPRINTSIRVWQARRWNFGKESILQIHTQAPFSNPTINMDAPPDVPLHAGYQTEYWYNPPPACVQIFYSEEIWLERNGAGGGKRIFSEGCDCHLYRIWDNLKHFWPDYFEHTRL
jgi:hypothetical protein